MSTWNNRIRRFSAKRQEKNDLLYAALIKNKKVVDAWEEVGEMAYEETEGRIVSVFTDEIRGILNLSSSVYVSQEQFNKDCRKVYKILDNLYKKYLQNN